MGFFKSLARGANKFFRHGQIGNTKFIGKNSVLSKGLGDVSRGLSQTGSVLGSVAKVGTSVLNNPLVQGTLGMVAPEALIGGNALTAGLSAGSSALKQGGQLTKQSNYSGNPSQVANNILERAKGITNTVQPNNTVSHQGQTYNLM